MKMSFLRLSMIVACSHCSNIKGCFAFFPSCIFFFKESNGSLLIGYNRSASNHEKRVLKAALHYLSTSIFLCTVGELFRTQTVNRNFVIIYKISVLVYPTSITFRPFSTYSRHFKLNLQISLYYGV
jgi:hypothetical protein